ncbi:MAG: hypothetical protein L0Y44_16095 [Phycisphaerales bacterium]|nr:hypothetical protein [Phycisphaerales bacterium]MCI0675517.1 hypothetical protein [Phycisphaerales bacterium]
MKHSKHRIIALEAISACSAIALVAGLGGCAHNVEIQPIKVEPIHMTVDINIKVDRELDQFFEEVDEADDGPLEPQAPATTPAPAR